MATKIEYTLKNGTQASMVVGSRATAEKLAKTLKNAQLSEVAIHAPVVHPKPAKAGTEADQRKSANAFYKGQRQREVEVALHLEQDLSQEQEAAYFARCFADGVPEWQAQQALRTARRELKNRKTA